MQNPIRKIISVDEAALWRENINSQGGKVVATNGCFDILHRGHVEYLFKAREQGDALIVFMNNDSSVSAIKGSDRPVNDEISRAIVLASLYFVDKIVIFTKPRCTDLLTAIKPDIYVKGADYNINTIDKEEKVALLAVNSDIRFIELTEGFSTTSIINKIMT